MGSVLSTIISGYRRAVPALHNAYTLRVCCKAQVRLRSL